MALECCHAFGLFGIVEADLGTCAANRNQRAVGIVGDRVHGAGKALEFLAEIDVIVGSSAALVIRNSVGA